ncbi:MAG: zinc-dependent alcohol dehydrogenase family protein [Pseudomonadota bacterium]|nr:zinc-dependent alcohol dehydrogenase family protein [Pseudomonadota bacterium]
MKALFLRRICDLKTERRPLELAETAPPQAGPEDIVIEVNACGVCHTELDEIEGRTPPPFFPVIPGHQVVGRVVEKGAAVEQWRLGDRVGVGWIYSACGECPWCRSERENLCPVFRATGRDAHGGYGEFMKVPGRFAVAVPEAFADGEAAPLLCAGAIGYRSLRLTGLEDGQILGLTGFGASAHLVLKLARHLYPGATVFAFARSERERIFARELGADWAGDTEATPPEPLDAVIDTTPAWRPVIAALGHLKSGGRLVINAIRKEETDRRLLAELDYPRQLWMEKEIKSVANVTRRDIGEFLALAAGVPIRPEYREYSLAEANVALLELKERRIRGAKVLRIKS